MLKKTILLKIKAIVDAAVVKELQADEQRQAEYWKRVWNDIPFDEDEKNSGKRTQ